MSKANKVLVTLADQSAFKPQLTVVVRRKKEQLENTDQMIATDDLIIDLVHPNTKEVIYSEPFVSKEKSLELKFILAIKYGKELLLRDDIKVLQSNIVYQKQIFIAQGKRGRVKLKTKERVEESERISKTLPILGKIEEKFLKKAEDPVVKERAIKPKPEKVKDKPVKSLKKEKEKVKSKDKSKKPLKKKK